MYGLPAGSCDHVLVVSRKMVELLGDGFSTSSESSPISHAGVPLAFRKLHVFEPTPLASDSVMALCTITELGASGREIP